MVMNIGLTGLKAANTHLEVVSQNVANVSTTGFKSGRAEFGDAYFLGAAAYGYQDVSTSRSAFGDILQGSYGSHSFSGRGELGYRFDTPVAGLIPYAAFQGTSARGSNRNKGPCARRAHRTRHVAALSSIVPM